MLKYLRNLYRRDEAASFIEYGLLITIIAIGCVAALFAFQEGVTGLFQEAGGEVDKLL